MKLIAALAGNLYQMLADEVRIAEQAVTHSIREASDGLKTELRSQVTGAGLGDLHPLEALETQQFADSAALDAAVITNQRRGLPTLDGAVVNAADHDPAEKIAVIQGGHLQLQGLLRVTHRGWNMAQDGIEPSI